MYIYMYTCTCAYTYVCAHIYIYIYIQQIYIDIYVCTNKHTDMYIGTPLESTWKQQISSAMLKPRSADFKLCD